MMDYKYFSHAFLKYYQNSLEYLIQNMIHQVIQVYHSMLELTFIVIVNLCVINTKI